MALALFDLDNTLIDGDSDFEWGNFLVSKKFVDEQEYKEKNEYFFEQYKQGKLDIFEYSAFSFKPLAERSMTELEKLHNEFMQNWILPIIKPGSKQLIEKHKSLNDKLIVITATNSFITRPIVTYLGITDLIATEPEIKDQRYTGKVRGTPCFQEGKVTRLNQWLDKYKMTLDGSIFYSDSHNDLPLLEIVDTAIAVDPDEKLREIAQDKDWKIISLK